MNILHVTSTVDRATGGPVSAIFGLAEAQLGAGLNATIFSTYRSRDRFEAERAASGSGIVVKGVGPDFTPWHWHSSLKGELRTAIAAADVVHIHGIWEAIQWLAAGLAAKAGKPYVVTPCGMLDLWALNQKSLKKSAYLSLLMRRRLDRSNALHYCSAQEAAEAEPLGLRAERIVRPNGIDVNEFRQLPPPGSFRNRFRELKDPQCKMVLFLGRVHPGKGVDILIEAMAALKNPDAFLVVAGPDPAGLEPQLMASARALGILDRVRFVGMLRGGDRIAALADADVFALASHHESFGSAVIEALAAGCPVVISEHVAIQAEIVENGVGSAAKLDPRAFAAALSVWLGRAGRFGDVARKARDFAFATFDWNAISQLWEKDYRRLIDRGSQS